MSYNTKYKSTFKDTANNTYEIRFNKLNYLGTSSEVTTAQEALIIEIPQAKKFDTVKGAGATIKLISETDRCLIDLYTANYKDWQIEVIKNGSSFFKGYVEPELYEEPFRYEKNYEVQISCNNGIGILERERYLNPDGSKITGLASVFDVVKTVISRLNLNLTSLNIATDLVINSTSVSVSKSILQYVVINNDNYTDEDGNSFDCRKVIESVLKPLSLTIFIEKDTVWIVDAEYLKKDQINYKSFSIVNNQVSSSCTNLNLNVNNDLSAFNQFDSSFTIEAGFNNYILKKNRYVKEIIVKVDFSDEASYSGDKYSNVWELKDDVIRDDSYSDKGTEKRFWLNRLTSFDSYYINGSTLPNNELSYFSSLPVAYAGGIKEQKVVDGVLIDYNLDDTNFSNYIFIQSPYKDYFHSTHIKDTLYSPIDHFDYTLSSIIRTGFSYNASSPFIFNSNDVKIRLNYTAKILSSGIASNEGSFGAFRWKNIDEYIDSFGVFLYYTNIHFLDKNDDLKYFLRLKGSENFNKDSQIPKYKDAIYELVPYTGQEFTYCLLYINNINEAGNQMNVVNSDYNGSIDIPVNFDKLYSLKVDFLNCFFTVTDKKVVSGGVITVDYYSSVAHFKESFPHIAFKDIYTEVIDKSTDEKIKLEDEEIEYYLSATYRTESVEDELLNFTAEKKYITDVAGIMIASDSNLSSLDYINSVSANTITTSNLEDLKGDKFIRQYQSNQVVISVSMQAENLELINTLSLLNDVFWNDKKWVITGLTNYVTDRKVDITIEEIF